MKALITLALIATSLTLSSCKTCPFAKKQASCCAPAQACCDAKPAAGKTAHKH
ncbi:MAG: hypothetical protein ACKVY0_08790 [Prosthecobacter sp.]|uniref:hypothetical protein n=1 Tax=Prosthecobacter sp. TaxID=1965333 RepID=UPI003903E8E0